jgi:C4-dicarboxylate transporter DctM subunit
MFQEVILEYSIADSTTPKKSGSIMSSIIFVGKTIDRFSWLAATIGGSLMLITMAIMNYEIVARYILNSPTTWSLEVTIIILIWFSFLGMPYVQKQAGHIRADIFLQAVTGASKVLWDLVSLLLSMVLMLVFTYYAYELVLEVIVSREMSTELLFLPLWVVKLSMLIGPVLFCLQIIRDIITKTAELFSYRGQKLMGLTNTSSMMFLLFVFVCGVSLWLYSINPIIGMMCLLFTMLAAGVPIFVVLGLVGMYGVYNMYGEMSALATMPVITYGILHNFSLASLPLFIMAGMIMEKSEVGKELFDMCSKLFAGVPGGLAGATILACALFAAISISSAATAATIGVLALPELVRRNYNKKFSYGAIAAGGTLGFMIPPSGMFILYSIITEESLGKLFMAGIIPGILISIMLIIYSSIYCKVTGNYDRIKPTSFKEKLGAIKTGIWGVLAPVIILVSIYSGFCTPLESAALVVLYTLIIGLVRRRIKLFELIDISRRTCQVTGMIIMLIIGALILGNFFTMLRLANMTVEWMAGSGLSPFAIMAILMAMYFVLGTFLEPVSVMLITLPVVFPLIISQGFNGIWFAVVVTTTMEIACITPPVGLNLFIIKGLTDAPLAGIIRGVFPFFLVMCVCLAIILAFPALSTWLPNLMVLR